MTRKKQKWEKRYDNMISQGVTEATRRSYERGLDYFWTWVQIAIGRRRKRYPVAVDIIVQFILDHVDGLSEATLLKLKKKGYKNRKPILSPATIKNILNSISVAHREAGKESPTRSDKVRLLMQRVRKSTAHKPKNKKAAITGEILQQMIQTCTDGFQGVRDKAMLLFGFSSGGRRRSEICNLQMEDLRSIKEGYMATIRKSKTDQEGNGKEVPVIDKAADALDEWIKLSGINSGPVFRGINNDDTITDDISGRTVARMIQKRVALIGLDPKKYGAHSLRSGFITQSGIDGVSLKDAMQLSHHTTFEIAAGYYREGLMLKNPATRLLDQLDI